MVYFVFWYPLIMSFVWIIGSLIFYFSVEKRYIAGFVDSPFVSLLVPCYNEQETINDTIRELNKLNYPNYEIILINDGSSDNTGNLLVNASTEYKRIRVIQLEQNAGKANALYVGVIAAKGEYIVGVDADSYLDPQALHYMIPHFKDSNVGAVTGNPRVRNRTTLLSRIQLCEFSSIITTIQTIIEVIFYKKTLSIYQPQCLILVCLIQFFIAMKIDSRYDEKFIKYYLWAIWYPAIYWYINALVVIRAIPKAILSKKGEFAVWDSPDRGL